MSMYLNMHIVGVKSFLWLQCTTRGK